MKFSYQIFKNKRRNMDILEKIKIKRDVQLEEELKSFKQPSLKEALKQDGVRIIGEIKRASPSKGKIANDDFDLLKQAQSYVDKG
ncbi:MAG: indole-3-glycerol phosphate synthase, partial [Leptotrichia wadei]|nr:indole-3-glycerol phosphate synthase [Leptotrichia wadei]